MTMTIHELKNLLQDTDTLRFQLENGTEVPAHFHVTEIGLISKHFIDCGGTERIERTASMQLWTAEDYDHRLSVSKLIGIIELGEKKLGLANTEIEVEYQGETIGKYALDFNGQSFILKNKKTDCLAKEECTPQKNLTLVGDLPQTKGSCTPGGGCC